MTEPQLINLPIVPDNRGNLSFIEQDRHVPFKIARSYWIYDVPGGEKRGGHAYHDLQEFVVALSGSFDIILNDGYEEKRYHLNRSYYGLYIPKLMWREIDNFSTNALAFILADKKYDEAEYIRDFFKYKEMKKDD